MLNRLCFFIIALLWLSACTHEQPTAPSAASDYPDDVAKIIDAKCSIPGCHNATSYVGSGDIRMDSWARLFDGGSNGAVVVPYSIDNSSLLYFINTDTNLGPVLKPTMPYDPANPEVGKPLSADEYAIIRNWIANGAPDKNGNIPFADSANTRQKIYLTMQGCDQIGVIDAVSRVVMRYITVGKILGIESPHCVRVDNSGRYAYVSFIGGSYVQKIDTRTDQVIGETYLGSGSWNVVQPSFDGKTILVSDWQDKGKVVLINTADMAVKYTITDLTYPHGIACSKDNIFYVTSERKNVVYKFNFDAPLQQEVSIGNIGNDSLITHEISFTPDYSKYFVTCRAYNQVRVIDTKTDSLLKIIPVGFYPQEIAVSKSTPYMFVTCMEDNGAAAGYKGCVYAINYNTYQTTRIDGPFYQPHGVSVDDAHGLLYIASANLNTTGPAPHHVSTCGGRNGYYNVYDLHTLQKLPNRYEVLAAPYSADVRFK